jgi:Tfp pilus assembly protein PilF
MKNYKNSVSFFKHFLAIKETADGHYQLSKSYLRLSKYLKAAIHITKAINKNKKLKKYFSLRSEIYELMNFKELAMEDRKLAYGSISLNT